MKHKSDLKDFSALSFEAGRISAVEQPPITHSPPRLTPVGVPGFNVQHDGAANGDSPENGGLTTTKHWPHAVVLLLSNDPAFQAAVRRALPHPIELLPVRHVEQAVRLAHESYVDVALLDLDLEERKGWRTAERLLADDATVRLLLAVETKERWDLVAGATAGLLLEKPVDTVQIVERVAGILRQSARDRFQSNVSLHNLLRYVWPLHSASRTISSPRSWTLNE